MARENYRTCITCGKKYRYCSVCGDKNYAWKASNCSPRCFDVSSVINNYYFGTVSAKEAMSALDAANYQEIESLTDNIAEYIEKIKRDASEKKRPTKESVRYEEVTKNETTPEAE